MNRAQRSGLPIAVIAILAWSALPLVWLGLVSILPVVSLASRPPDLDPGKYTLDRYVALLSDPDFVRALVNSLIAASATVVVCLTFGSLAGYALARLEVPGKNVFVGSALATQMVPGIVLVIPIFLIVRTLGLIDSVIGLIGIYTAFMLPYSIWLLRNFFAEVPVALERAARIDGCSRLGALFRVIMPTAASGIAATGIFVFISVWNEFLFALVLTHREAKTVTVRLAEVQTEIFGGRDYGMAAAAGVLTVLPVVVAVVVMYRFVARSLTEGAVKG